jgi:adenosylcobinamide-phosphate synthase
MTRSQIILAACLLDSVAGDPEWFPHPVRLMGLCSQTGERLLRKPDRSSTYELITGAALTAGMVAIFYVGTAKAIRSTYRINRHAGVAIEILLAWSCLAARSLHDESSAVVRALDAEDISRARQRLARIVGRDTQHLDESEICRALIETIAESSADGIFSPLFYMAIGGVPLAMAYKTINTLDSMIGHKDTRYFYFGKLAARLDDAANFLPSRLTAMAIAFVTLFGKQTSGASSLQTWLRDGDKHSSPNAGQPESAMAGALQVRLGGSNTYGGEVITVPLLGSDFAPPSRRHAKRAIRLVTSLSVIGAIAAVLFSRYRKS